MPVKKCLDGRYRIGDGPCVHKNRASASRAYVGYLVSKKVREQCPPGGPKHDGGGRGVGRGGTRRGLRDTEQEP